MATLFFVPPFLIQRANGATSALSTFEFLLFLFLMPNLCSLGYLFDFFFFWILLPIFAGFAFGGGVKYELLSTTYPFQFVGIGLPWHRRLLEELDTTRDGVVSFDEFLAWWKKNIMEAWGKSSEWL